MRSLAIRASAGTGKTYELALHYIARLAQGASPDRIVATTFTRKAAGEIMARVLARMADAAHDPALLPTLDSELRAIHVSLEAPPIEALTTQSCTEMLRRTCLAFDRINVSTIDAFFVRMLAPLTPEAKLASMPALADERSEDIRRIRAAALQATLDHMPHELALGLLDALNAGRDSRVVAARLDAAVAALHATFLAAPAQAWDSLRLPEKPLCADADTIADELERQADLVGNKQISKGYRETARAARAHDWPALMRGGPGRRVAEGATDYYGKPIEQPALHALKALVGIAAYELAAANRRKTLALRDVLTAFSSRYLSLLRSRDVLLFSELPEVLASCLQTLDDDERSYRLSLSPDHLLLDEFQDTNREQWQVLRMLLHGREPHDGRGKVSLFCVGDPKQAIYGWRGGCAAVFDGIADDVPGLVWQDRSTSHRSSQVILDWVDRVFGNLPNLAPAAAYPAVIEQWRSTYRSHVAARELPGFAELLVLPESDAPADAESDDGLDPEANVPVSAASYAAQIAMRHPWATCGVLTRTNTAAASVAYALQSAGLDVSLEGPGAIADDPAVELVLSAFLLADHPGSSADAFHVFHSPLRGLLRISEDSIGEQQRVSRLLRRLIAAYGYGDVVVRLSRALAPWGGARTARRLTQLTEDADEYDRTPGARPADFVDWVRSRTANEPSPAQIRVLTIHQSKGLEFDVVILPELATRIIPASPTFVTKRRREAGPIEEVHAYPSAATRMACPQLAEAARQHRDREFSDALNVLYVAMTRARHALHMLIPMLQMKKDGTAQRARETLASILRCAFGLESADPPGPVVSGDPQWWERVEPSRDPLRGVATRAPLPPARVTFVATTPRRTWTEDAPSSLAPHGAHLVRDLLATDAEALDHGAILHAFLQRVEWIDGGPPDDEALARLARAAVPGRSDQWIAERIDRFHQLLRGDAVRQALTRPVGDVELWQERAFAVRIGSRLSRGRIDRLELHRSPHGLDRAVVTDIKTDRIEADAAPARSSLYRPQMAAYREAVSVMLQIPIARVSTRLLFLEPDLLVEVE